MLLLVDLADRARLLVANYTDAGAHPRAAALTYYQHGLPSLHLMAGSARAQIALFVLAGVAAALLAVGWRTRIATFVSWFLLGSLHARNELVLDGGDHLLRYLLFWCLFLPLGARWSLDARRRGAAAEPARRVLARLGGAAAPGRLRVPRDRAREDGPRMDDRRHRDPLRDRPQAGGSCRSANGCWPTRFLPELLTPAVRVGGRSSVRCCCSFPFATVPLRLLGIAGFWAMLAGLGLGLKLNLFPFIAGSGLLRLPAAVRLGLRSGGASPRSARHADAASRRREAGAASRWGSATARCSPSCCCSSCG